MNYNEEMEMMGLTSVKAIMIKRTSKDAEIMTNNLQNGTEELIREHAKRER